MRGRFLICCLCAVSFIGSSCGPLARKTTIKLDGVKAPEKEFYNIYRYSEPITEDNHLQAELVATRIPGDQASYTPEIADSGTAYYLVTICDVWGREKRVFNKQSVLGPFEEEDTTSPEQSVDLQMTYTNDRPALAWKYPPYGNPEGIVGYNIYRSTSPRRLNTKKHLIATVAYHPVNERGIYVHDVGIGGTDKYHYFVAPFDSTGNESAFDPSFVATAMISVELSIARGDTIVDNKDFSTTKMYPVKGEKVSYRVRIRNHGAKPAEDIPVDVSVVHKQTQQEQAILERGLIPSIGAGESHELHFDWEPQDTGAHSLRVAFNAAREEFEQNYGDNEAQVTVHVVSKDVYFIWYGDPIEWKYVNAPQAQADSGDFQYNMAEWHRRGARYLHFAHLGASAGQLNRHLAKGVDGVLVDELGPIKKADAAASLLKRYAEHKETYPESFVAVWKVGGVHPALAEALTKEKPEMDLLLFEQYFYVGSAAEVWQKRLLKNIEEARSAGSLHRCVFGLGSAAGYGKGNADKHFAFLEEQIAFIREHAPEMPGVGFFTDRTLPGVGERVDRLCYEYFVKQVNERKAP